MRSIPAWNRSALLLLITVAAYFHTWIELWPYWEHKNATYTHGTLIAAVTLWLIWRARDSLVGVRPSANPRLVPLVLVTSIAWLLAARANLFLVHAVLWPVLALTILAAGVGWRAASSFVFPLAFIYFAIPIWEYLKPPLQALASTVVGILTGLLGVPAFIDGSYVVLPNNTIFIALECSGTHFLCVSLAVGALAGELRGDSIGKRLLIMALAAVLSMIFNWLRILLIVFAYLNADLKDALETMGHYTFGWWVFALDLVVLCLVLRLVPTSEKKERRVPAAAEGPVQTDASMAYILVLITSLLLPTSSWALQQLSSYPGAISSPVTIADADGPIAPDTTWKPRFVGAAWEHRVAYVWTTGRIVELYRNEYHRQSQGKELISNGSPLFDPAALVQHADGIMQLTAKGDSTINVRRTELVDKAGRKWLALYTYIIDEETYADPRRVQLVSAVRSLYEHSSAGVLAVMALCGASCEEAEETLKQALTQTHEAYCAANRDS